MERLLRDDAASIDDLHCVRHTINKEGKYLLSPLTLCKRHTQLYWKKLRKNTGVKLQYMLVGEYGHNYGRPHYHAIVWTNEAITPEQFQASWSFGHVDFEDVKENSKKNGLDEMTAYRYVCKYLYKDFDFMKIPTLKYHYKLYEKCKEKFAIENRIAFMEQVYNPDEEDIPEYKDPEDYTFKDYIRDNSSFMCCSKSPAIGSAYLSEFLPKFQRGYLRIFGVHGQDLVFPRFFTRKVKQSICPFVRLSEKNGTPCSPSCTFSLFSYVMDFCTTIACYEDVTGLVCGNRKEVIPSRLRTKVFGSLDFYDVVDNVYYLLNVGVDTPLMDVPMYECYKYNRHTRKYEYIHSVSVINVLNQMEQMYSNLVKYILKPFEQFREANEMEFRDYVLSHYGTMEEYKKQLNQVYNNVLLIRKHNQEIYNKTKTLF
ncbi:MAG: hypothetical protein NC038_06130 [Paludibacter sp.]|nr:hypothetical protein [Bacteroidales bacterium]MCM1069469.1 hypothetical protein [Prevotella sp.]MCM1354125.1 hypothetical protein [Bacteroides sp.]MCM1443018.1 hypothetical protein [Muribaculum sp.]MCM1482200.1 hypothetical protein [Paludibacter sp.]